MCALPKGFRKKVNFIKSKNGPEKRQEYLDEIDFKGTFSPKGITFEDIDRTFFDFIEKDLLINIKGEVVPVIVLTIQKWMEFSKTWEFSDNLKNLKMPFITIVRQPVVDVGTNQAGNWNIPGHKLYTYLKIPTLNGRKGMDTYKIPQPTSVDITYDVRLFCNRMKDLNIFHHKIQNSFNSRQYYIKVNGHPMPIHLENISDESQIENFDKRRFYVQHFEMLALAYTLDENEFEVIPSIDRAKLNFIEMSDKKVTRKLIDLNILPISDDNVIYKFKFKPKSLLEFNFTSDINIQLNVIQNIINVTNIIVKINTIEVHNGLSITTPIEISNGDIVTIIITTNDIDSDSLFEMIGEVNIN